MNDDSLLESVIDGVTIPHHMTQKDEIVEYYKDTLGKAWKQTIVKDVMAITGLKQKSVEKRFDPQRLHDKPRTAKAKAEYEQLGKALPPISRDLVGDSITFRVSGTQGRRQRSFNITMSGSAAYDFVNNPSWFDLWDYYGVDGDLFEDGEYEVAVSGVSAS